MISVLDASAKIPSGLLNGNVNNFGEFDQCVEAKNEILQGKYCLVEIDMKVSKKIEHIWKTMSLMDVPYTSNFDDVSFSCFIIFPLLFALT